MGLLPGSGRRAPERLLGPCSIPTGTRTPDDIGVPVAVPMVVMTVVFLEPVSVHDSPTRVAWSCGTGVAGVFCSK